MSKLLINKYYTDLDRALQFGKTKNETSVRHPFLTLLNEYARKHGNNEDNRGNERRENINDK